MTARQRQSGREHRRQTWQEIQHLLAECRSLAYAAACIEAGRFGGISRRPSQMAVQKAALEQYRAMLHSRIARAGVSPDRVRIWPDGKTPKNAAPLADDGNADGRFRAGFTPGDLRPD